MTPHQWLVATAVSMIVIAVSAAVLQVVDLITAGDGESWQEIVTVTILGLATIAFWCLIAFVPIIVKV